MTKDDITREQLIELTRQYSYHNIARKILHIRDINLDKLLKKLNIEKQPKYLKRVYPEIPQSVKEYILGSLLGDMSVVKKGPQHRLSISHSAKQMEYIKYQKTILGELALNNIQETISPAHKIKIFMNNRWEIRTIKKTNCLLLHSKVHPYFTELRKRVYINNKKTLCQWWLDQLTERSLAYWVMDDGSADYSHSYVITISTYGFTYNENLLLQQFLKQRFNLEAYLQPLKNRGYGYTVRFNVENSKKLRDLIRPYIPTCMRYKTDRDIWIKTR
jgi:hypothetical protein